MGIRSNEASEFAYGHLVDLFVLSDIIEHPDRGHDIGIAGEKIGQCP